MYEVWICPVSSSPERWDLGSYPTPEQTIQAIEDALDALIGVSGEVEVRRDEMVVLRIDLASLRSTTYLGLDSWKDLRDTEPKVQRE